MAAAMVGGAFLSASLQVLFDRIASRAVMDSIRGQKVSNALLKKLKISLLAVNAVLNDAEEKQISNPAVKAWLDELKDATYDAEDLLDEITTEALRCKLEADSLTSTVQVRNFLSTSLSPFDEAIKSKIEEILDRLEYIIKQKEVLGLKEVAGGGKLSQKFPTTSLVEESGVYGRDDDKEEIIKLLLSDDATENEICVITIVGMGGVGKTTLAQFVYNDNRVKEHFDLKVWVCVSQEFDVSRVTKTILEAVNSSACDSNDLNLLQVKLKDSLTGKNFLIVFDDVWNEKYKNWDDLRNPFRSAAKGSKIIVTTRSENVASIMRTTPTYHLRQLLDEDCWLLFSKHAFYSENTLAAHPNLNKIGREIVKKCKGLPLAAKTLAGLLRSKVDAEEWDKILKSDIWELSNDESDILPALRLSYHYLPSHLKRCFTYCSIFPKGYEFQKEQLVLLWMAEDFLQPQKNKRMEDLGDEYFCDLISRSFFERSSGNISHFVMHDLVNDLAKVISGEFCFRMEDYKSQEILEKTRHLSYFKVGYDASKKYEALCRAKCFRTFLSFKLSSQYNYYCKTNTIPNNLMPTLRCLRVLTLSNYHNIVELPESIGTLKHLRYLNLSHTSVKNLPNSTCTLYNLQTLILSGCNCLSELPSNIGNLINLRHLYISGTNLKRMPRHMSRLTSLQTLSTFIVDKNNGSLIGELRELRHLRGTLHIRELQNVVHVRDVLEANLKNKEHLDELVLGWSTNSEDSQNERDVLDKLQPHTNLKKLSIEYNGGTRFPDWLGDHSFSNMVYLRLSNCKYCFSLPPLGQLSCLKDLSIIGFDAVERVGPEFFRSGSSIVKPFGLLEILKFENMLQWVDWFCSRDEGEEFPRLIELYIEKCPRLKGGLPSHLPSLEKLVISECQQLVASLPRAPAVRSLEFINCDEVLLESNGELNSQPSSHVPEVSNVTSQPDDQITSFPDRVGLQHFSCLDKLKVSGMTELKELPSGLHRLAIKHLEIWNCPSLKSFPCDGQPSLLKSQYNYYASLKSLSIDSSSDSLKSFPLGLFPKLTDVCISGCKTLESLWIPEGHLTSLSRLQIRLCPKFVSFPSGGLPAPNLTYFLVENCENLKSLPERMHTLLPSLQCLNIWSCSELEIFPEGGLPSNLMTLSIFNCDKLTARRMEWGLQRLASLRDFHIEGCEVEFFPEEWLLPSSLTFLTLGKFPNLKYLNKRGLQQLTSLEELKIWYCSKLQCLPEETLPASLSLLYILESPLLKQRCQKEKGEDWPKIAHIPRIVIDYELIS